MRRDCGIGNRRACDAQVVRLVRLARPRSLLTDLRVLLGRQCEAGVSEACVDLACMQRDGWGGPSDMQGALWSLFRARSLLQDDCERGWDRACKRAHLSWAEWGFFRLRRSEKETFVQSLVAARRTGRHRSWTEWVRFIRHRGIGKSLTKEGFGHSAAYKPLRVIFTGVLSEVQPLSTGTFPTFDPNLWDRMVEVHGPGPVAGCFGTLYYPYLVIRPGISARGSPRRYAWPPSPRETTGAATR